MIRKTRHIQAMLSISQQRTKQDVFVQAPHPPDPHIYAALQKPYEDSARIWMTSQFEVEFVKKRWNEADSNPQTGSSIAASGFN
jgi:hypothetical protein